jgi:arsenate reductase
MKLRAFIILACAIFMSSFTDLTGQLNSKLSQYCKTLSSEFDQISEERKKDLQEMGDYIAEKINNSKNCKLLFICTSNSRRSHMGQIWAYTASQYYELDNIWTFSGGTEETKVNINAINALRRCGFEISTTQETDNPIWMVQPFNTCKGFGVFSKKYNNTINPKEEFCALMVCSEADHSCPIVEGAELRIPLPYHDPKIFDNKPEQDAKYDERCRQIAREMFYAMDYAKKKLSKN